MSARRYASIVALAAALVMAAPAQAQVSAKGGPISYSADNLEYTDSNRQLILTGNVDLIQDDARLRSDRLVLFFARTADQTEGLGSGDIERVIAQGKVHYVRPDQTAVGDRAVYEVSSDTVTFTGDVVVETADNVIRGERLVLEISGGRTTLSPGGGQRVQGVFRPRQGRATPQDPTETPAPNSGN
jgi:lipopolysaccharide export system protein LptA